MAVAGRRRSPMRRRTGVLLGALLAVTVVAPALAQTAGTAPSTPPRTAPPTTMGRPWSVMEQLVAQAIAAEIQPTADPNALAQAITTDPSVILGASFVTIPPLGTPTAVATTPLAGFPRVPPSYAIMTTGNAAFADDPNTSGGEGVDLDGPNVRGNSDFDVTILKIDLRVPAGVNCLTGLDFRFLTEEFPEYVGDVFNDAFIAELDQSTWTTSGSTISAPNNFAFDPEGSVISVNAAGVTSMSAAEAAGTTYDGATPLLTARTPITPGDHSLFLSIFDQGDHILDSAVFLDGLTFGTVVDVATQCVPGAEVVGPGITPGAGSEGEWIPLEIENVPSSEGPVPVRWSAMPGPGVDPGATCTFSDEPPTLSQLSFLTDLARVLGQLFPQSPTTPPPSQATSTETFIRCTDDGVFIVTAEVGDPESPVRTTTEVSVLNAQPMVVIESPPTGTQVGLGQAVTVRVLFTDPGTNDTHTCAIDWGDGTRTSLPVTEAFGAGTCEGSHTYAALGQYVITALVRDDDTPNGSPSTGLMPVVALSIGPDAAPTRTPTTSATTSTTSPSIASPPPTSASPTTTTTAAPDAPAVLPVPVVISSGPGTEVPATLPPRLSSPTPDEVPTSTRDANPSRAARRSG